MGIKVESLSTEQPLKLPLAGDSRLVVVGKEVGLGNGSADLVAIEPSGRLVILEIKLSKSAEARRAVVAQILTYAAHLKGLSPETVERDVLGHHLRKRGYESLQDAVASNDQEGSFESTTFSEGLTECLANGHFRLVLVLDEAPQELSSHWWDTWSLLPKSSRSTSSPCRPTTSVVRRYLSPNGWMPNARPKSRCLLNHLLPDQRDDAWKGTGLRRHHRLGQRRTPTDAATFV